MNLILGAGPTGLGAARRLEELDCHGWLLLEAGKEAGGLFLNTIFVDQTLIERWRLRLREE